MISQSVSPNKKVEAKTSVSYTVSKGKKPVDTIGVPSIINRALTDAKSRLKNVGLNWEVREVDSNLEAGVVVSCDPGEGTKVQVGSVVVINISKGPKAPEPIEPVVPPTEDPEQ